MKPIAVLYLPMDTVFGSEGKHFQFGAALNGDKSYYDMSRELYGDYLWWCFPSADNEFHLEVFYPKDFTEIEYQELKQMLEDELKKMTTKTSVND